MIFRELGKFQAFLTRNTDTIKNTYVRKLTSIALMAIMVGGGLTFAIPGMEPAYAAQINNNPNLLVSAEGQNADNEISVTNVVEVVINDNDINTAGDSEPRVTVDGTTMQMYQAGSGAWYGYFAAAEIEAAFGLDCSDANFCTTVEAARILSDPPARSTHDDVTGFATVQLNLYPIAEGDFDIVYEKAGGDQTVTLELGNPDVSVSTDRSNYPQNTDVVVTIDDLALNVDPTGDDTWYITTDGNAIFASNPTTEMTTAYNAIVYTAGNQTIRDNAIEKAGTDRQTSLDNAEDDRDEKIKKERDNFNKINTAAQPRINDPLIAPDEKIRLENLVDAAKWTYDHVAGIGERTDRTTTVVDTDAQENDPGITPGKGVPDQAIPTNWKGTAQIEYENLVGTFNADGTPAIVGDAQKIYQWIVGIDDTDGNRDGTTPVLGDDTNENGVPDDQETDGIVAVTPGYRGTAQITFEAATNALNGPLDTSPAQTDTATLVDFDTIGIDTNSVLECANTDCAVIDGVTWIKLVEDDSNESTFTNTNDDADASLKTAAGAQRGLSFSITYDNTVTPGIGFSTTSITIDAGAEWNSGQEIGVTLTDSDANTNSLTEETLSITDTEQIIPTIKVGEPFTLAAAQSVKLIDLKGTPETTDDDDEAPPATNAYDRIDYEITSISDILDLTSGASYLGNATLSIGLGAWDEVNDFLPQNEPAFRGTHMVNYDVSELGEASSIVLRVGAITYPLVPVVDGDGRDTAILTDASFDVDDPANPYRNLYDDDGNIIESDDDASLEITLTAATPQTVDAMEASSIVIDVFSFGLDGQENPNTASTVNNAIYRLELEEDGDNSSDFIGTLEYIGLNQINMYERSTYDGISTIDDNIILISDDDSISVEYRDLDANGVQKTFTAGADTPTHSGSVSLNSDGYKVADTVTVTVDDADLNTDSVKRDVYTLYEDQIDSDNSVIELLSVSIDSNLWDDRCGAAYGLEATQFSLRETENDSGIFTGTFSVPAEYCADSDTDAITVTGADISVEYVDFRDDSGSLITVSASAGIRSTTGSVSLDRTVYPVPFGADDPADNNDDAFFGTHADALPQGDLTVYVSIEDSDFDESANGIDSIPASATSPLEISIIRGSTVHPISVTDSAISETAADSGIFEYELTISYDDGPESDKCPVGMTGCILQGDILHVEYSDPSDASGSSNTVTDSATFDLRNGVLQSDQTAYIIGSDMIVTLIEPDLNLDSGSIETYDLDLIEWDSDAGTCTLAGTDCDVDPFGAVPSNLLETGSDTGIFQVVVGIPNEIDEDRLERGEEITLTYIDWGPSGSDYVGDKDEEITTTVYTSNFGATVDLDQRVYTWTDKVYVTIVAPDHNIDSDQVDEIGNNDDYPIRISTRGNEIEEYKLVETGADTGIFTGEITLIGFGHDADGDGNDDAGGQTSPDRSGPTDGQIGTESESGISVSFKYSEGETVSSSALIRWNVGEVQWLEASYPASGSGIVRVIDPDMNLNPEAVDNFDVTVWSDSDGGGIDLTVTETNAATGIFEGTVFFGVGVDTSGHRLRVVEGDTVTAQYYDNTLPAPFKETERVRVGATTLIGTIVPPLERAPITDLRAVDSFGNTLDVISVDSQIQLAADLTNNQDKAQEFAYLIQIQDENGVTVSLDWIAGSLTAGQSLSPASSWTPDEAGTYEVTAFVWESIENPTALSPTATIAITVN